MPAATSTSLRHHPDLNRSTLTVHAGRDRAVAGAPLNDPPVFASAFHSGCEPGYARDSNPTWCAFEAAIGTLEGGHAVSFPSGMSAAAAILDSLPPTAGVVVARSAFAETRRLIGERQAAGRLRAIEVDPYDPDAVGEALQGADALWLDAISNPGLDVPALDHLAARAQAAGATTIVDATLATPLLVRPLALGGDVVLHSATKYIGGHSDLLLGVAAAREPERASRLRDARTAIGASPGTMEAWLALRGLRTLALRLDHAQRSARVIAERLIDHADVVRVRYPGLPGDPAHAAASRLFDGYGAVLAFEVRGADRADAVCEQVGLITHATSLGGVETLIERPGRWHGADEVPPALLRLSVGCEDVEDVWTDLDRALVSSRP